MPRIVAVALAVALCACASHRPLERVGYPLTMERPADAFRWDGAVRAPTTTIIGLSRATGPARGAEDPQIAAARFEQFLVDREAVLAGVAGPLSALRYHTELMRNLDRIDASVEELNRRSSLLADSAQRAEADRFRRGLARLRQQQSEQAARVAAPAFWGATAAQAARPRTLCYVDVLGVVYCMRERDWVRSLVGGQWQRGSWQPGNLDEAKAHAVVRLLDGLRSRLGLSSDLNTTLICSGGYVHAVRTYGDSVRSAVDTGLPSASEMAGLGGACNAAATVVNPSAGAIGMPTTGSTGQFSPAENQAIAELEADFTRCVPTGGRGQPAPYLTGWLFKEGLKWALNSTFGRHAYTAIALLIPFETDADVEQREREQAAVDAGFEAGKAFSEYIDAEGEAENADAVADEAEKDANDAQNAYRRALLANIQDPSDANRQKAEVAKAYAEALAKIAELERQKAEEARKKTEEKKKEAEEKKKKAAEAAQAAGGSANSQRVDDSVTGSASCEARQQAWTRFKRDCDRRGGWSRAGDVCNELLRRKQGCVSTLLINPGPEGDQTCRREQVSDEEVMRKACENRQQFYIVGEQLYSECTLQAGLTPPPARLPDVCKDPRARPREDQMCTVPLPTQGPAPGPGPSVQIIDGVGVLDAHAVLQR